MIRISMFFVACLLGFATAQVPGFGWCPDYQPMADFDLNRYIGVWYEAERYFTVLEAGSRCVRSNYTKGIDSKFRVSNEITNRLTGIRRVLDGVVQNIGKGGEGKISVKYNTLPVPIDTQYSVLDTDYDTYSVVWSCSSLGPINTQNAWIMTRDRQAPGSVLQQAYGVLDKFKISKTFFVKTDQSDCLFTDPAAIPAEQKANEVKTEPMKEAMPMPVKEVAKEPAMPEEKPVKVAKPEPVPAPVAKPVESMPMPAEAAPMPAEVPAMAPVAPEPVKPVPMPLKEEPKEPIKVAHEKVESMKQ